MTFFFGGDLMYLISIMSIDYKRELPVFLKRRLKKNGVRAVRSEEGLVQVEVERDGIAALSKVLADLMLCDLRPFEIMRLINLLPKELRDKGIIFQYSLKITSECHTRDLIEKSIAEYLLAESVFVVEGFLRFRNTIMLEEWAAAVDKAGEEHLLAVEYRDILKTLRLVNSIDATDCEDNGAVVILYGDGSCTITMGCIRIECCKVQQSRIISLLVTLAPVKVTVYDLTDGSGIRITNILYAVFNKAMTLYVMGK